MNKLILLTVTIFFCVNITVAQDSVDMQMMQKIKDEEKNNSQVSMIAHNLTDVCGPRLTNSPGYNCALAWVTDICKKWGLQKAGREAWGEFGKGWSSQQASLSMRLPYYENIIAYPVPWCKSTRKGITSELFMLNNFDSASIDKAGDSIKGKIVMIKPGSTDIPDAFKASAIRYADTSLNNLPDNYMVSRKEIEEYLPYIKKNYYTTLYLEKKGAVALCLAVGTQRTVPCL